MVYLVVGIDHATHAPWHENVSARDVARAAHRAAAAGIDLLVAAVIGPNATVLPHPVGLRAAPALAA